MSHYYFELVECGTWHALVLSRLLSTAPHLLSCMPLVDSLVPSRCGMWGITSLGGGRLVKVHDLRATISGAITPGRLGLDPHI